MTDLKETACATVLGDVVGSRRSTERSILHRRLRDALADGNAWTGAFSPVVPLRITVGDEFQGCFATVGSALQATLRLRVALLPDVDVRFGVGWGPVAVLDEEPRVEDGPGWWAARAAIEAVKRAGGRGDRRLVRTSFRPAEGAAAGTDAAAVNAALLCRDQLVGSLSDRSLRLLHGALDGATRAELAAVEGISASAVSQRFRADGLGAVLAADELMGEVGR